MIDLGMISLMGWFVSFGLLVWQVRKVKIHEEVMKLRRKLMGMSKEAANRAKAWENHTKSLKVSPSEIGTDKEIDRDNREASQYELFAKHIDEILNTVGIEVLPEYRLKRDLIIKEGNYGR